MLTPDPSTEALAGWLSEPPIVGKDIGLAVPKQRDLARGYLALAARLREAEEALRRIVDFPIDERATAGREAL